MTDDELAVIDDDYDDPDDGWLGAVPAGWPRYGSAAGGHTLESITSVGDYGAVVIGNEATAFGVNRVTSMGGDVDMERTPDDVDGLVALVDRLRGRVAAAEKVCAHVTVASGRADLDTLASLLGEWREAVMRRD